jgi:hypothetical protein
MKLAMLAVAFLGILFGFWGPFVPFLLVLFFGASALRGPSTGITLVVRTGLPRPWR